MFTIMTLLMSGCMVGMCYYAQRSYEAERKVERLEEQARHTYPAHISIIDGDFRRV